MAGRHRRTPAWRRALLRLRRSDRAARVAALEAQVVALHATVGSLRSELDQAWTTAAALASAASGGRAGEVVPLRGSGRHAALAPRPRIIDLTLVEDPEMDRPLPAGITLQLDLKDSETRREVALAALPEAAMLDPRQDRDGEPADATPATPARRSGTRTA